MSGQQGLQAKCGHAEKQLHVEGQRAQQWAAEPHPSIELH